MFESQMAAAKIIPIKNKVLTRELESPEKRARPARIVKPHSSIASIVTTTIAISKRAGIGGNWVLISEPPCETILGLSVGLYLQTSTKKTLGITENYGYAVAKSGPLSQ
jgi:hypothetical protein